MISHISNVVVRYGETDQMGYVHHGVYPLYYEFSRTEMLKTHGFSYKELEKNGILLPVYRLEIDYLLPAYYDESLTIKTMIKEIPGLKIKFYYEIYNSENVLINKAMSLLVFVDGDTRKPRKPPKEFLEKMKEYFNK